MKWQCSSCDKTSESKEDLQGCIEEGHTVIQMLDEGQVIQASIEAQDKKIPINHVFQITKEKSTETKSILNRKFHTLRPQTLLHDDKETVMILVYLPTKLEITKGQGQKEITSIGFENSAYFIISTPKEDILSKKRVVPFDNDLLKEQFKIDILPTWDNVRWDANDITRWEEETSPTEPKKVYELINEVTRQFIEFPEEYNYVYLNLWNIATYFYELFDAFPGNDFTGTKRAGKSKVLEFQKNICYNAIMSPDMSGSAFFRIIEGTGATVLLDETENFKDKKNEMAQLVRRLIMQGMLKGQSAVRSESKESSFVPKSFNIYSPKSMAHIQNIDDVMQDRFIKLIMKRAKSKKLLNAWPNSKDPVFQQIRNLCYRLFLDYAYEIYDLQEEARSFSSVSGRELQLWTPIVTLALFFEKHGILGLMEKIENFTRISSKNRQTEDEEQNYDLKILTFVGKEGLQLAYDMDVNKNDIEGWVTITQLYDKLTDDEDTLKTYEINTEYFKRKHLREILVRLGFRSERKSAGISYLLTKKIVNDTKERLGLDQERSLDSHIS